MKLLSWSLIYKICRTVKCSYEYIKDRYYIKDTLYSPELKAVLKKYLYVDFKEDWIGRLYGVINPNINSKGELDFSNTIIELNGDFTNSTEYVKHWTFKQLDMVGKIFKINKLYDYLDIEFRHVGPDSQDNYLIIFDIVSRKDFADCLKSTVKQLLLYSIIGGIIASCMVLI